EGEKGRGGEDLTIFDRHQNIQCLFAQQLMLPRFGSKSINIIGLTTHVTTKIFRNKTANSEQKSTKTAVAVLFPHLPPMVRCRCQRAGNTANTNKRYLQHSKNAVLARCKRY
ncbi:hypothetical protein, partial [Tychonema sp. LEGE 07203]|uniref:hypothetical protein n=1 Tax=Tychonema sp. LEGE 07203 TaxID=1828671 RepID=UPI001D13FD64